MTRAYNTAQDRPATNPQITLLNTLIGERDIHPAIVEEFTRQDRDGLTVKQASAWITIMLEIPKLPVAPAYPAGAVEQTWADIHNEDMANHGHMLNEAVLDARAANVQTRNKSAVQRAVESNRYEPVSHRG